MTMKYNRSSRYMAERTEDVRSSLLDSPTLLKAAGMATVAGAAVSGVNALLLIALVLALTLAVGAATLLDGDRLEYPLKPIVYAAVTSVVLFAMLMLIRLFFPEQLNKLGIYAPLLAFNSLVLCRIQPDAPMLIGAQAVTDALGLTAMFALTALPVSLVREVLGYGKLFGISLGFDGNIVFLRPFAGFILAGFAIAFIRSVIYKKTAKEETNE